MKPQEKAKELVDKYDSTLTYLESKAKAKQCALIAVDEIITELTQEISPSVHGFRHTYWKEVKEEIEKL